MRVCCSEQADLRTKELEISGSGEHQSGSGSRVSPIWPRNPVKTGVSIDVDREGNVNVRDLCSLGDVFGGAQHAGDIRQAVLMFALLGSKTGHRDAGLRV